MRSNSNGPVQLWTKWTKKWTRDGLDGPVHARPYGPYASIFAALSSLSNRRCLGA
jgi:hypothetical protein